MAPVPVRSASSGSALQTVAGTVQDQPEQYEKLMLQAAALNPACYYDLGDYDIGLRRRTRRRNISTKLTDGRTVSGFRTMPTGGCNIVEKGRERQSMVPMMPPRFYSSVGFTKPRPSFWKRPPTMMKPSSGLQNEERYNDSGPLIDFCMRCKEQHGDQRFSGTAKQRGKAVSKGVEKDFVGDFKSASRRRAGSSTTKRPAAIFGFEGRRRDCRA